MLNRYIFAPLICVVSVSACAGHNSIDSTADLGLRAPKPAPVISLPAASAPSNVPSSTDGDLYAGLPIGPRDTGTYPDLRTDPEARIIAPSKAEIAALEDQLEKLERAHRAGRVSTANYNKRLAYLRALAKQHSPEMLRKIGEPAI